MSRCRSACDNSSSACARFKGVMSRTVSTAPAGLPSTPFSGEKLQLPNQDSPVSLRTNRYSTPEPRSPRRARVMGHCSRARASPLGRRTSITAK